MIENFDPNNIVPAGIDSAVFYGLLTSLVLIAFLWGMRLFLVRTVSRRSEILSADQRRWVHSIRSAFWILMLLGLAMIWAPQLHTVALSLTAFVVALVIATKEVIMCVMGAFMRVSTAPFRMGDWIRIENVTGEVVNINAFSAKVQELETEHGTYQFTGKVIQIPNSRYFTFPIENLSHLKQYRRHLFTIALQTEDLDAPALLKKLQPIVEKHTSALKDEAIQNVKKIKKASHIPLPDPAPHVTLAAKDFNNIEFSVFLFLPTTQAKTIEHMITNDFMAEVEKIRTKKRKAA